MAVNESESNNKCVGTRQRLCWTCPERSSKSKIVGLIAALAALQL